MVKRALLLAVAVALIANAGCGGGDDETTTVRAYWLRDGKVWPQAQEVSSSAEPVSAALTELLDGKSDDDPSFVAGTAIPEGTEVESLDVTDGVASVTLSSELSDEARAQVVYTLTQFPEVETVEIEGTSYTRADFEDQTPSVLVESPLPFDEVTSPLRAEGTANTFEATFAYTITDSNGTLLAESFVTATSGTGTRGTFELTESFDVPEEGGIVLTVFENSAEDGRRIHEVEIPLIVSS